MEKGRKTKVGDFFKVFAWFCAADPKHKLFDFAPQGPHSQILMTGGGGEGGSDRGSYFIPKKITTSEFVYTKIALLFFRNPKNSLCLFYATQINPGVFHRPKKITFGQNFRPKTITRCPRSLKYVSGAPWFCSVPGMFFAFSFSLTFLWV